MRSGSSSWPCAAPAAREMLSFISVPPMSLAPLAEALFGTLLAQFDPADLDVGDDRVEDEAGDGVHEDGLAIGRALAGAAFAVDRGFHMHEGQRHEFGEAAGALLQCAQAQQMPGPMHRTLDMAEHDGRGGAQADIMGGLR